MHPVTLVPSSYTHVATNTTTLVKTGTGILRRITVNTTSAGAITVYDSLTGSGTTLAILKLSVVEGTFEYGIVFAIGLTIVTAGASDITIVYD